MLYKKYNDEVLIADDAVVKITKEDIQYLKRQSQENKRKRIRLCSHQSVEDRLHEMFIVHTKDTYVRPHKHLNKSESVHIIEGEVDVVFFDDEGIISDVIQLGNYKPGKNFYYRTSSPIYHTLLIRSDVLVFHEIINGPFIKEDTVFASWAPDGVNENEVEKYLSETSKKADKHILKEAL